MSWKQKKVAEVHKRYFDWGEFFGTIFFIGFLIICFLAWLGS